mmetsp:Transcript_33299/g.77880  ORF Transcript_33299/g.77880 Transcript_33299/m.77880 type:complete len:97 (-) Transcript_33299:663-953(-)
MRVLYHHHLMWLNPDERTNLDNLIVRPRHKGAPLNHKALLASESGENKYGSVVIDIDCICDRLNHRFKGVGKNKLFADQHTHFARCTVGEFEVLVF